MNVTNKKTSHTERFYIFIFANKRHVENKKKRESTNRVHSPTLILIITQYNDEKYTLQKKEMKRFIEDLNRTSTHDTMKSDDTRNVKK